MSQSDSPEYVPLVDHGANKKMSIERIYQKKTQLEHILLRPDTYIGSVEPVTQSMWVYDGEEAGLVHRDITYVPGLYKIFDEIIVNAADNKQRCPKMDTIKIDINPEKNEISVYNNGTGIPVVEHKVEKMFVPSLIFGHLLTSSNYNDEEKKVTGGRNGFGAKLCNIFSLKFSVETSHKESGNLFKQVWKNNMSSTNDAAIKPAKGEDYTCIKFTPDLQKFKMTELGKDIVGLMSRRAFDVAGTTKNVKVYLNGKRLPIKGFKDYVDWYIKDRSDEQGNPLKVVYEVANDRWEVAVTCSDKGLQQVSFANSIATTKGGRHVDHVLDQVTERILEVVKKKTKKEAITVKPFQIKNHMWVFVNCLIVNPTFDSQTKELMTLQVRSFGSKCTLSDKFMTAVQKSGIVESILTWVQFKSQTQLNKKCSARTLSKLKGLPKLDDANDAGTKQGIDCTLILTEGDSAKSLAVAGLGVIGRDRYGVFPLKGKILNVREASAKQIMDNAEINNIIKIVGLQYKKKYEAREDLLSLRYGHLMIMTDQDQDGSHIKGLLINFIHHNWPGLLKLGFLEQFITPIVKVKKDKECISFYSLPEFEEWKKATNNWRLYKTKYYKGLGTSTAQEAKEYFANMDRHRIRFKYHGAEDDNSIQLAFSKKMIEQRKEWLTNGMEERKRRKELGLSELYLYNKTTTAVSYQEFVNKELILFSNMDNERSIPSIVDGFKPGSRKVMYTCFKRKKGEVKVAQLAGSVAELSAYHHGEVSLMGTIINLAQNFIGSNNLNLLMPIGQFGTRIQGGKDCASPRYIFTKLSPLTRLIFKEDDDPLLNYLEDDNLKIEPDWYIPIIPMLLVNGAEGIGTGWMTKIPNYDVRQIVDNLRKMINGEEPKPMIPSYKNFRGQIHQVEAQRFISSGIVSVLNEKSIEITELPVRTWTQAYKESVLEPMLYGNEKGANLITDYKEYHTDTTVRFVVSMTEERLAKAEAEGLHKVFKLCSSITTSSMVLFDHNGVLRRFDDVIEILREFYTVRLEYYSKRKIFKEGLLKAELAKLSNQARFILEKISGEIVVENKRKGAILTDLIARKYDPDPVKRWKETVLFEEEKSDDDADTEASDTEKELSGPVDSPTDFDYLMNMKLWNLSREKKDKLLEEKGSKEDELNILMRKTPSSLWLDDLDEFSKALDECELREKREEQTSQPQVKKLKTAGGGRGKKAPQHSDTLPSACGRIVEPVIDRSEVKKKTEKVSADGTVKKGRKKKDDSTTQANSSDDEMMKSLSERLGQTEKKTEKRKLKQTTLNFEGTKKPKVAPKGKSKKKTSDDESSDVSNGNDFLDSDDDFAEVKIKQSAKETAEKQSSLFDSLVGSSDNSDKRKENGNFLGDSDSEQLNTSDLVTLPPPKKATKALSKKPAVKSTGAPKQPKKTVTKKRVVDSSDEDSPPKKKKRAPPKKSPVKITMSSDEDSDLAIELSKPNKDNQDESPDFDGGARSRSARARAPVNYHFDDSDDNDSY
ncbi:DNA topoisomerase 2-alpha [Chamberlinius hualienensis]